MSATWQSTRITGDRDTGLLLLEAVEEIARLGGQRDLYLHLRYAHTAWHWKHVVFAPRRT